MKKIDLLRFFYSQAVELRKISYSLNRLDVAACNYQLTKRQEKRVEKLEKEAFEIANKFGLKAYHQRDPRGCSLYLTESKADMSNYDRGIAIF